MGFVMVVVSFLLSTTVSLVSLHVMGQRNVHEMNKVLTTQIYDYITNEVAGPITAARTMASTSFLTDLLDHEDVLGPEEFESSMASYLADIEDGLGYQAAFVISDATKRYYTRDGYNRTIDPEGDELDFWYASLANSKKRYELDVDNDEKDKDDLVVYVNARMEDKEGRLLGICGLGVHVTGLQGFMRTFENTYNIKIYLVSPDGTVQVDTDIANIEAGNLRGLIAASRRGEYAYTDLGNYAFAVSKYVESLGWFLIVRSNSPNNIGQFANVILLNALLCVTVITALVIALRINRRHRQELANATFVDHATDLANKRAYEHDRVELEKHGPDRDLVCVAIDVNGLKTVNDTLGHDAGDELIRGAADCLKECLEPYGTVYRTGGDEFVAILSASESQIEHARKQLAEVVAAWSGTKVESLSMSYGFASAREFPDETPEGLAKIADERMYEDKDRYYASKGLTRRKT